MTPTEMIAALEAMTPMPDSCPAYWTIQTDALKPSNRAVVMAAARAARGIAANHVSAVACRLAMEAREETGCHICLFVGQRLDFARGIGGPMGAMWHRTRLEQLQRNLDPAVVLVHYEGKHATEGLAHVYREIIRESYPDAKVGFYHWPGWHMGDRGAALGGVYPGYEPPADLAVCNLYGDAAHNSFTLSRNADFGLPVLPFISADFTYRAVAIAGRPGWHSDTSAPPTHADAWLTAARLASAGKGIDGIYLWNFLYRYPGDDGAKLRLLDAFLRGWRGLEM